MRRRLQHDHFIRREIELDAGQATAWLERPTVVDSPLRARTSTLVLVAVEANLLARNLDPRLGVDPFGDLSKYSSKIFLVEMLPFGQREVEVFREAIGFEVDFLEAGASFEDPGTSDLFVVCDTRNQPAEHVVLLDNLGLKGQLARTIHDVSTVNHSTVVSATLPEPVSAIACLPHPFRAPDRASRSLS